MQKINLIPQIFEKLKFKKSCNPIGGEHFGLLLENQIFPRHLVLKIFSIYVKTSSCKNQENPLSRSWEKCVTDGQIDRQMDRWTGQTGFYRNPSAEMRIQRFPKQWSLANLRNITFILFECHRSIAKSTDFYFFLLQWKSS